MGIPGTGTAPAVQAGGSGTLDQFAWATFLLEQINANGGKVPITLNNVDNITRWMVAEEPPNNWFDRNNPLNASLGNGSTDGTGSYTNLSQAANYTSQMILQSNMGAIYRALAADAPTAAFSAAVVSSPWASGHYGGNPNAIASIGVPASVPIGPVSKYLPADLGAVGPGVTAQALGAAGTAAQDAAQSGAIGLLGELASGAGTLAELESAAGKVLGDVLSADWWKRVGIFTLGVVLIGGGIILFVSTTKTGQKVESDAATAAVVAA